MKYLHAEIQVKLLMNRNGPAGARRSVVIDGPPTVGKSTLVKMFAADFEQGLRRSHPEKFTRAITTDTYIADYTPVAYLSIPSQATPKDLSAAFAEWFGIPLTRGRSNTKREITDQVLTAIRACGTELIIIDDVHFLDLSLKEGQVVNDHIKYLANHAAATFIFTGVHLETSGLFLEGAHDERASQNAGRNGHYRLDPFSIDTPNQQRDWARVIKTMEDALVLADHTPGTLLRELTYLHKRTSGSIASLSALIREGAIRAVLTGQEHLTRTLLDTVVLDRRATRNYDNSGHPHPRTTP